MRTVVVAGILLVALAGCGEAKTKNERDTECANAATFTDAGFPGRALAVVGEKKPVDSEPPSCAATREAATKRRTAATDALRPSPSPSESPNPSPSPNPATVTEALALDRENPAAVAALYALATTTGSAPDDPGACTTGGLLVKQGFPRQALVLLGNDGGCASQRSSALAAIAQSATLAQEAIELQRNDPSQVHARADQALVLDRDNLTAQTARSWVAPAKEQTAAEQNAKAWEDFTSGWLTPLGKVLPAAVAVFVALLLAGRLLTAWRWLWWLPGSGILRKVVRVVALVLSAVTALAVPRLAQLHPDPLSGPWLLIALAAVIDVVLVAAWMASGYRLTVQAKDASGEDSPTVAASVLAFVAELGGEQPRGAIVGRSADVTVLDGAGFEVVAANKVVAVVLAAARGLVGFAPWSVRVVQSSDTLWTSTILRNGRPCGEAVINAAQLRLVADPDPEPATKAKDGATAEATADGAKPPTVRFERLVAAHVLTTMAESYKQRGFEALGNVRSWRSLGLQYVAQTDLEEDDARATEVLSNALDFGPNSAAAYALEVRRYREDPTDSDLFADRLAVLITDLRNVAAKGRPLERNALVKGPLRAQWQRMLYLQLAALINATYQPAAVKRVGSACLERRIERAARDLYAAVAPNPRDHRRDVTEEIRPGVAALLFWVKAQTELDPRDRRKEDGDADWTSWVKTERGALADYQLGCLFTTAGLAGGQRPQMWKADRRSNDEIAVQLLKRAAVHPRLAKWRNRDPQLSGFVATSPSRLAFNSEPSTDMLSLPAFSWCRDALTKQGLTEWLALREALEGPDRWWRKVMDVDRDQLRRMRRTMRAAAAVPEELAPVRVELCRELINRGELAIVDGRRPRDRKLARTISDEVGRRCSVQPNPRAVAGWLRRLRWGLPRTPW